MPLSVLLYLEPLKSRKIFVSLKKTGPNSSDFIQIRLILPYLHDSPISKNFSLPLFGRHSVSENFFDYSSKFIPSIGLILTKVCFDRKEMDLEKLCCYSERECNEPVAKDTGYCESHILSSRFAEELGYRQCAYKNNQKVSDC